MYEVIVVPFAYEVAGVTSRYEVIGVTSTNEVLGVTTTCDALVSRCIEDVGVTITYESCIGSSVSLAQMRSVV